MVPLGVVSIPQSILHRLVPPSTVASSPCQLCHSCTGAETGAPSSLHCRSHPAGLLWSFQEQMQRHFSDVPPDKHCFSSKSSCHIAPLAARSGKPQVSHLLCPYDSLHSAPAASKSQRMPAGAGKHQDHPHPLHWRGLNQSRRPGAFRPILVSGLLPPGCHATLQHSAARASCHHHDKQCRRPLFPGTQDPCASPLAPS